MISSIALAATGHRPDKLPGGYSDAAADRLRSFAVEQLRRLAPGRVISGMALGWDLAVAEAAIELSIPFTAAIPFVGQHWTWPTESRIRYGRILQRATDTVVVCPGGYTAWKMQLRNVWMVDRCDVLLALWNESEGGTKNCVDYACMRFKTTGKPVIDNVWDQWIRFCMEGAANG